MLLFVLGTLPVVQLHGCAYEIRGSSAQFFRASPLEETGIVTGVAGDSSREIVTGEAGDSS